MPMLLQSLFEETKNHNIPKKDQKKMSRSCKYIENYQLLPELTCPAPTSNIHKKDMEDLLKYYHNPNLPKEFLENSHKSSKGIFKKYCKEHNLQPDWNAIKNYTKDLSTIVTHLKYKHKRPRPKEFLDDEYKEIEDMFSPSFPSGHTASAYFIAELLSNMFSNHSASFDKIAQLIGQSRIENGVHFPSDVWAGRFIGETLAKLVLNKNNLNDLINFEIKKKDEKDLKDYLKKIHKDKKQLCYDMSDFISFSNKIENININYDKCFESCKKFLSGYPINECSKDRNIISHLKGMVAANKLKPIDSPYKYIVMHKQFDKGCFQKGYPGTIRNYKKHAKNAGNSYSNPSDIINHLEKINYQNNPYVKHILFEWIHPFEDGNGRVGRIALLVDDDFNFQKINNFCNNRYIDTIIKYIDYFKDITKII